MVILLVFNIICKNISRHDYTFIHPVIVKMEFNKEAGIQSICMESGTLVWHHSQITSVMKYTEYSNINEY